MSLLTHYSQCGFAVHSSVFSISIYSEFFLLLEKVQINELFDKNLESPFTFFSSQNLLYQREILSIYEIQLKLIICAHLCRDHTSILCTPAWCSNNQHTQTYTGTYAYAGANLCSFMLAFHWLLKL